MSQFSRLNLVVFVVPIVIWTLTYYASISTIIDAWLDNGAYSHGLLSFAFSLYIVWRQREQIQPLLKISSSSILLILAFSFLWWIANVTNVLKVEQLAVYLLLVMILVATGGWRLVKVLRFPLLIVLLVLPVWDFLQSPLQDLSTYVTYEVLKRLGIPTLQEGHQITVPGGRFLVEEACSGLGFFLTALLLAVFYSYLNRLDLRQSCKLGIVAAAIAILANWIRIVTILLVGNYTGMDHVIVTNHLMFGWVVFSIALVPFFLIAYRWFPGRIEVEVTDDDKIIFGTGDHVSTGLAGKLLVVSISIIIVPIVGSILGSPSGGTIGNYETLPLNPSSDIVQLEKGDGHWDAQFMGADDFTVKSYTFANHEYQVLLVRYFEQHQGRELINVNNRLYARKWNEIDEETRKIGSGQDAIVRLKTLSSGHNNRRMIAYWYVVGGRATSSPLMAKLLEVYGILTGNRSAAIVAIATDDPISIDGLLKVAHDFYVWSGS